MLYYPDLIVSLACEFLPHPLSSRIDGEQAPHGIAGGMVFGYVDVQALKGGIYDRRVALSAETAFD